MIQLSITGIRFAVVALVLYWMLIFIGTHIPAKSLPAIHDMDKAIHATVYAGLSFLIVWALPFQSRWSSRRYLIAAVLATIYGIFDEVSQVPVGRTADVLDWIYDCIGVCIGIALFIIIRRLALFWVSSESFEAAQSSKSK